MRKRLAKKLLKSAVIFALIGVEIISPIGSTVVFAYSGKPLSLDPNQEIIREVNPVTTIAATQTIYTISTEFLEVKSAPSFSSKAVMFSELSDEFRAIHQIQETKGRAILSEGLVVTGDVITNEEGSWVDIGTGYLFFKGKDRAACLTESKVITDQCKTSYSGIKLEDKIKVTGLGDSEAVSYSIAVPSEFLDNIAIPEESNLNVSDVDFSEQESDSLLEDYEEEQVEVDSPEIVTEEVINEEEVEAVNVEMEDELLEASAPLSPNEVIEEVELTESLTEQYSDDEVYLLAQLMYNEAAGEGEAGQIAVAEVVLNRVNSSRFPNTVEEVIYSPGQFANNGAIKRRNPSDEMVQLADSVLNGNLRYFNNPEVLFFRNAHGYTCDWGTYPHYDTVNHHEFYTIS